MHLHMADATHLYTRARLLLRLPLARCLQRALSGGLSCRRRGLAYLRWPRLACALSTTLSAGFDRACMNLNWCTQIVFAGVDSSEAALELARANAQRNGVADVCRFVRADVAEFMRAAAPQAWDLVVLDPPKLAPSRKVPPCQQMPPPCMPAQDEICISRCKNCDKHASSSAYLIDTQTMARPCREGVQYMRQCTCLS